MDVFNSEALPAIDSTGSFLTPKDSADSTKDKFDHADGQMRYYCSEYGCISKGERKGYSHKVDLARHIREQHGSKARRYMCHIKECPRGISGQGFTRMNQLVGHLASRQHTLSAQRAKFEAANTISTLAQR